jgi:hypothetical protein
MTGFYYVFAVYEDYLLTLSFYLVRLSDVVVIVASMLVSPIMGPVLGLTFGSRIQDWPLVKSSLRHELLALLGCVLVGALIACGASFTSLAEDTWPTNEMQIRGEPSGLLAGIAIAIPSGMGVCLSILGGNVSSLVGVAISASLLPPAVNAGVCFTHAIFLNIGAVESHDKNASDFVVIGGISFALTVLNIICIWISGLIMFEIKKVAPLEGKKAFWTKDIKLAREWNRGEKPPPIDVNLLRSGLRTAMARSHSVSNIPSEVKIQPQRRQSETGPSALGGSLWVTPMIPEVFNEDDHGHNGRYVGLEDMGALLGFDDEDDIYQNAAIARRLKRRGRGRYL